MHAFAKLVVVAIGEYNFGDSCFTTVSIAAFLISSNTYDFNLYGPPNITVNLVNWWGSWSGIASESITTPNAPCSLFSLGVDLGIRYPKPWIGRSCFLYISDTTATSGALRIGKSRLESHLASSFEDIAAITWSLKILSVWFVSIYIYNYVI